MITKHTPGPWKFEPSDSYPHLALLKRPYAGPQLFSMEDAKLIAAAPDMAQTLLGVRTDLLRTDFKSEADRAAYMIDYIERVLAKAGV